MPRERDSRFLVVIPAYNEEAAIGEVIRRVTEKGFQVLVVDDGSTDGTRVEALSGGAEVISHPGNAGVGEAIRTAFAHAAHWGFDGVVQCDGDGQHPIDSIPDLIAAADGVDMVVGSRFRATNNSMSMGRTRRVTAQLLAVVATQACGTKITDPTSGFRCIRQPLLGELSRKLPSGYLSDTFEVLVAAGRSGYSIREIPAPFSNRMTGVASTGSLASAAHVLRCLARVATRREMKLTIMQR